jgi:hypothetical protein
MTQDEIIEMARQAGGIDMTNTLAGNFTAWIGTGTPEFLERFAKLVAAKKQEDIIQIIKETQFSNWFQADVIEAIRARGTE